MRTKPFVDGFAAAVVKGRVGASVEDVGQHLGPSEETTVDTHVGLVEPVRPIRGIAFYRRLG